MRWGRLVSYQPDNPPSLGPSCGKVIGPSRRRCGDSPDTITNVISDQQRTLFIYRESPRDGRAPYCTAVEHASIRAAMFADNCITVIVIGQSSSRVENQAKRRHTGT